MRQDSNYCYDNCYQQDYINSYWISSNAYCDSYSYRRMHNLPSYGQLNISGASYYNQIPTNCVSFRDSYNPNCSYDYNYNPQNDPYNMGCCNRRDNNDWVSSSGARPSPNEFYNKQQRKYNRPVPLLRNLTFLPSHQLSSRNLDEQHWSFRAPIDNGADFPRPSTEARRILKPCSRRLPNGKWKQQPKESLETQVSARKVSRSRSPSFENPEKDVSAALSKTTTDIGVNAIAAQQAYSSSASTSYGVGNPARLEEPSKSPSTKTMLIRKEPLEVTDKNEVNKSKEDHIIKDDKKQSRNESERVNKLKLSCSSFRECDQSLEERNFNQVNQSERDDVREDDQSKSKSTEGPRLPNWFATSDNTSIKNKASTWLLSSPVPATFKSSVQGSIQWSDESTTNLYDILKEGQDINLEKEIRKARRVDQLKEIDSTIEKTVGANEEISEVSSRVNRQRRKERHDVHVTQQPEDALEDLFGKILDKNRKTENMRSTKKEGNRIDYGKNKEKPNSCKKQDEKIRKREVKSKDKIDVEKRKKGETRNKVSGKSSEHEKNLKRNDVPIRPKTTRVNSPIRSRDSENSKLTGITKIVRDYQKIGSGVSTRAKPNEKTPYRGRKRGRKPKPGSECSERTPKRQSRRSSSCPRSAVGSPSSGRSRASRPKADNRPASSAGISVVSCVASRTRSKTSSQETRRVSTDFTGQEIEEREPFVYWDKENIWNWLEVKSVDGVELSKENYMTPKQHRVKEGETLSSIRTTYAMSGTSEDTETLLVQQTLPDPVGKDNSKADNIVLVDDKSSDCGIMSDIWKSYSSQQRDLVDEFCGLYYLIYNFLFTFTEEFVSTEKISCYEVRKNALIRQCHSFKERFCVEYKIILSSLEKLRKLFASEDLHKIFEARLKILYSKKYKENFINNLNQLQSYISSNENISICGKWTLPVIVGKLLQTVQQKWTDDAEKCS